MEKLPRISIVTPSYNQAQFIRQTIESVISQDYPDLEYFVIDGGSTDGSVEIIREYEKNITYWVSEKDNGQSHAIIKGFARASGAVLNWINSDDILFPASLMKIGCAFAQHPDADLIVGDHIRCLADGTIVSVSAAPSLKAMMAHEWVLPIGQQSTFFSHRAYTRVGGLREDLHAMMDSDLYRRMLISGSKLIRVRGMIGAIRVHPQAKGEAQKHLWTTERPRLFAESKVVHATRSRATMRSRVIRALDGTYVRALFLRLLWTGKNVSEYAARESPVG